MKHKIIIDAEINDEQLDVLFSEIHNTLDLIGIKTKIIVKLQIGMRVRIKTSEKDYPFDSGKVKVITSELPDFGSKRAFGLDGDTGIWCIEDFARNEDYPHVSME